MTLQDAVYIRSSRRRYLSEPVSGACRRRLMKDVERADQRSGLHIRLVCGDSAPFQGQSRIAGAENYLVFAGPQRLEHLEEKCGYFGEELILTAAAMGLGSCWLGGSFDRSKVSVDPGDELVCAAALGPAGDPSRAPRALKDARRLSAGLEDAPPWFRSGVEAVRRAPSAMDRQGYRFRWEGNGGVTMRLEGGGSFALVDMGIAKLHFELGAHGGSWTWGDGGSFTKAEEEKSCGAVVRRERDGRREYLLVRHNAGHWSFPKGHVEPGETEGETARREVLEETGIRAELEPGFREQVSFYPRPGVMKDVVFFLARPVGGAEKAQEAEIADLGWFPFDEARERMTFAADEGVLLAAEERP